MRALVIFGLTVAVLLPDSGAVGQADGTDRSHRTGSVSGTVSVSAPQQQPPPPLSPYARRRARPPQEPGVAGGPGDAFVYLEAIGSAPTPPPTAPARIVQRERLILPHASAVQRGQTVEFPNDDDVFHNLFSLSPGNRFSLGRYAPGVSPTHTFEEAGVVRLFCDIHAEMAGVVLVVDTPWLARVGGDGSYDLTGIPAGEYRAVAWHPTAGADTLLVAVADGREVEADFALVAAR